MSSLAYPQLTKLVLEKNIKLHLQHSKVVKFQSGALAWVAPIFGAGIYGIFDQKTGVLTLKRDFFYSSNQDAMKAELNAIELRGLEAVAEIGLLTGSCCICGRTLTADDSIAGGIGPICAGKVSWSPRMEL